VARPKPEYGEVAETKDFDTRVLDIVRFHMRTPEFEESLVARSIPNNVVQPVIAVTELPYPSVRYEGQEIDYWPSGTAGTGPLWRLTWRGAANGGSGAWMVAGAPLIAAVTVTSGTTTSATYVTMGSATDVAVPATMVAHVKWTSRVWSTDGGALYVRPAGAGIASGVDDFAAVSNVQPASLQQIVHGVMSDVALTAGTITLYARTNSGTMTWSSRSLEVHPVEIRP
jgi:hypothetical protein